MNGYTIPHYKTERGARMYICMDGWMYIKQAVGSVGLQAASAAIKQNNRNTYS